MVNKEVFEIIKKYVEENGISPSVQDIVNRSSFSSKSTALIAINELEEKGYLKTVKFENGKTISRGIILIKTEWEENETI